MRLIRENVEREADGTTAEKLISDGFTPMGEKSQIQYQKRKPARILKI